jgi:hypothetical protein
MMDLGGLGVDESVDEGCASSAMLFFDTEELDEEEFARKKVLGIGRDDGSRRDEGADVEDEGRQD